MNHSDYLWWVAFYNKLKLTITGKFYKSSVVSSSTFFRRKRVVYLWWLPGYYFGWFFISFVFASQIKALIFYLPPRFHFLFICLCLYFITVEMVSPLSYLIWAFVPLEFMFLLGVLCGLFTASFLVSIDRKFSSTVEVLFKELYVWSIIISPRCLPVSRALVS